MKKGQFSQEQITRLLQTAETGEQTISDLCRQHGITETTFYRWRNKFSGSKTDEALRLKTLEQENARLKRLLAERNLYYPIENEVSGALRYSLFSSQKKETPPARQSPPLVCHKKAAFTPVAAGKRSCDPAFNDLDRPDLWPCWE